MRSNVPSACDTTAQPHSGAKATCGNVGPAEALRLAEPLELPGRMSLFIKDHREDARFHRHKGQPNSADTATSTQRDRFIWSCQVPVATCCMPIVHSTHRSTRVREK